MNLGNIPYMVIEKSIDFGHGQEEVHLSLCLTDHHIVGIGRTQDEAIECMTYEFHEKYEVEDGSDPEWYGFDVSNN